jgi:hypothetical protein
MEYEFLAYHLVVYIKKRIVKDFTTEMTIDDFYYMKHLRRA